MIRIIKVGGTLKRGDAFMKLYEAQPTISIPMRKPSSLKSKFISGPL